MAIMRRQSNAKTVRMHVAPLRQVLDERELRGILTSYGAPLMENPVTAPQRVTLENVVVESLRASRKDALLLRVLPVVLLKNWQRLDFERLNELATRQGLRRELGVLLDLTRFAAGPVTAKQLAKQTAKLGSTQKRPRKYFPEVRNQYERELAVLRNPALTRRWNVGVNMSNESVKSFVLKHCADLALV